VLDGEIRNAAPRIEPVRFRESRSRADVETGAATSATVRLGRVGRQIERGEDRAEEPAFSASGFSITAAVSTKTFTSPPAFSTSQRATSLSRALISS